jgi:spermidine synthase
VNRNAFLLGFYSIGGQVLLLRELVSSLNGDELFIGTALFGWLVSVAVGAYIGGLKRLRLRPALLFLAGVFALPIIIVAVRHSPLLVSDIIGEIIPFSTAAMLSCAAMLPVGIISGWLFTSITRQGRLPSKAIVRVYLFEGIGAFVGGVTIVVLVGAVFSTLQMSVVLGTLVLVGLLSPVSRQKVGTIAVIVVGAVVFLILVQPLVARFDAIIEHAKYSAYTLKKTFDTHYGHQTILSKDGTIILLTDNTIEAVFPELEPAENLLIPPLVYRPEAREILFLGRAEFGLAQLAKQLPGLSITALDPRRELSTAADEIISNSGAVTRLSDDPVRYFTRPQVYRAYDVIILNVGGLDSYKNSRLLTVELLQRIKRFLKEGGVLYLPTRYDTDRYITVEGKRLLSLIYRGLKTTFKSVALWPGNMTLLFASDAPVENLPYDSIIARLDRLPYSPQYISDYYLQDRLNEFKTARLRSAVEFAGTVNTLDRPLLAHYQAWYRSKASAFDRRIMDFILGKPVWVIAVPLAILVFLTLLYRSPERGRRYGLFLYFTAGVVSLTLELVSFYVYQSSAGSLYLEMAVLIGAFMLGLAVGTYYSRHIDKKPLEYLALFMLLTATVLFAITHQRIQPQALLFYHLFFLFAVAAATGSLFVAATNRFYPTGHESNRGAGYACELIGSSVGALFTMTILLPIIGLQWLLTATALLTVLALAGSILTTRS